MAWGKNGTPNTLTSAGDTITISDLTAKKFNVFLSHIIGVASSSALGNIRVGNGSVDSGSNYTNRMSQDGGADGTYASESYIFGTYAGGSPYDNDKFQIVYGVNIGTEEKLFILFGIDFNATGSSSVPSRQQVVAKWTNTSDQYDNVQEFSTSYDTGSNLSAFGTD